MALLGVNIDHVATVRQARRTDEPDPVWAAVEAQLGGADLITFHLREDRRHILDRDVPLLREVCRVPLNMEMAVVDEMVAIACRLRPEHCCLVPEKREEVTTEGGLDVVRHRDRVARAVHALREDGITVSAFIEPIEAQIQAAAQAGCHACELWTGGYAHAMRPADAARAIDTLRHAVGFARGVGLEVNGGHGLTYRNIPPVAAIQGFSAFHIGHSIVSRAIFTGMREAVCEMKRLITMHTPSAGAGLEPGGVA